MNTHHRHRLRSTSALIASACFLLCAGTLAAGPLRVEFDRGGAGASKPLFDLIRENGSPQAPIPIGAPVEALNHEDDLDRGDPMPWDGAAIRRLAHELETAADQLYHNYRDRSDTGNVLKKWSRQAAINVLRPFWQEARHFHQQVESRFQDPAHTREDFRRLMRALDEVDRVLPSAYHADRVREEYHRATQLADSMLRYYRSNRGGGGGWRYWETVKSLAHKVDEKAAHAYEQALRDWHHGNSWERRAIEDLREFADKARHFHRQLEDPRQNPDSSHTRADYQKLLWAYERAESSLRWAHPTRHVQEDFEEAGRALRDLARYYDGDDHDDDHDRDHDRDPDHGHDPWPFPRW